MPVSTPIDVVEAPVPTGHPRGLVTLFLTEMWERFSFFGMVAILVLYLTAPVSEGGLGMSEGLGVAVFSTYVAIVGMLPVAGGWVADRLLGARRTVLVGGILIACGHYAMATRFDSLFWLGLLVIALGTGLLKPNVGVMVGALYGPADPRRDSGFTIYYMGINIGALTAPLAVGYVADRYGFHWGFLLAGLGMTIALAFYLVGYRRLGGICQTPGSPADTPARRRASMVVGGVVLVIVAVTAVLNSLFPDGPIVGDFATAISLVTLAVPFVYFVALFRRRDLGPIQRDRVKAFLVLFLAAVVFGLFGSQAGSTLTLFARDGTDLNVGGFMVPPAWIGSANGLFVIIFAPIFGLMWVKLGRRAPSTPMKSAIGLTINALVFLMLLIPVSGYVNQGHKAAIWWIVGVYMVQVWAELCILPVGLSASTKLAPRGVEGQLLALWFVSLAVGATLGGRIGLLTDGQPLPTFIWCALITTAAAATMYVSVPWVRRKMHGVV